jgi:radical SAM protein with 4Fe4S-binding SPASM domain
MGFTMTKTMLGHYQDRVDRLRGTPYMDYPAHVHLETVALCPAACNFCPYPTLDRKGDRMTDALLDKVLTDLQAIPNTLPFQLSPFKVNEPFLDNRLIPLLQRVNDALPNASITITTNLSPLTPEKLHALCNIRNIGYLWVSTNESTPEAYEQTMQLPWSRTQERLAMVHEAKSRGQLSFDVVLSRVGDGSPLDNEFHLWVRAQFPLFKSFIFQRGGWLGQVDLTLPHDVPDVGCVRWFDISITANGTVAHCCMDGNAQWPIGDVNKQSILEIYNQPHYRRLRENTISRRQADPCRICTFL